MSIRWTSEVPRRTALSFLLVAAIAGIGVGFGEGLTAQAIIVEVQYPGATSNIPWICAVQVNNDPTFKNFSGSGTQSWSFYYVHNILANCSKADNSIYSIAVALKTGSGQFLGQASGYPTARIGWIRPSGTCSPASQCPVPQAPILET